jgi:hypothetical protein
MQHNILVGGLKEGWGQDPWTPTHGSAYASTGLFLDHTESVQGPFHLPGQICWTNLNRNWNMIVG